MTDCGVAGAGWTAKDYVIVVMSLAILLSILFTTFLTPSRRGSDAVWGTKLQTYTKLARLLMEMQRHFTWALVHDDMMKRRSCAEDSQGKTENLNQFFFAYAKLNEVLEEDRLICSNKLYRLVQNWHNKIFMSEADRFSIEGADAISLGALKPNVTKFANGMLKVCKSELGITDTSRWNSR